MAVSLWATPTNRGAHTFMHVNRHLQQLPVRMNFKQSSLLDCIQDTQEEWRRDVGLDGGRSRGSSEQRVL